MGSPTVSNAKPVPMENTDKKFLTKLIKSLLPKKKKKEKKEEIQIEQPKEVKPQKDTVAVILESFNKLNLEQNKVKTVEAQENEDDELDNFNFKVIEEPRNERIHSQSSGDSGFSDKSEHTDKNERIPSSADGEGSELSKKQENIERIPSNSSDDSGFSEKSANSEKRVDKSDDLADELEKLELDDDKKKKKKLQTVALARRPIRNKLCDYSAGPYPMKEVDPLRQFNQINKHTLTGGQVIINECSLQPDNFSEVDIACEKVQQKSQFLQNDRESYLQDVLAYIHEDTSKSNDIQSSPIMAEKKMAPIATDTTRTTQDYFLTELEKKTIGQEEIMQLLMQENNYQPELNPMDDIVNATDIDKEIFQYIQTELHFQQESQLAAAYTYPTPPRSENVPSPMSPLSSLYVSNSDYTLSPQTSPTYNSDYEKYQDIPHFEEEKEAVDKKARERTTSISSMTMKQFKDMQKEIVYNFSKKECCQISRKSCKELFLEHLSKLKMEDRKDLCMKVVKMDLKTAYGVLHHILISLSQGSEKGDLEMALFALICERVLAEDITVFTGDAGLGLLKAACLRCPHKPLLTRYLVQCTRLAIKSNPALAVGKDCVFHEVDALGDTLVTACARAGDRCADVLSELLRAHDHQPALFKHDHYNSDGYTALHVACSQHSAGAPRLHVVHVLIEHAGFNIKQGDVKGRDTALHLAVNAAHCDVRLVLLLFAQVDRKEWKQLAHLPNLSTKTPIDLARLATKSSSRPNYPLEVLDFLKKCR